MPWVDTEASPKVPNTAEFNEVTFGAEAVRTNFPYAFVCHARKTNSKRFADCVGVLVDGHSQGNTATCRQDRILHRPHGYQPFMVSRGNEHHVATTKSRGD